MNLHFPNDESVALKEEAITESKVLLSLDYRLDSERAFIAKWTFTGVYYYFAGEVLETGLSGVLSLACVLQ